MNQVSDTDTETTNKKNLKKMAAIYGTAATVALTLFGAAHTWANLSGWPLAIGTAIAGAFVAGMILSSISHEWGHFAGAAASKSTYKITPEPIDYFFFLNFNPGKNTTNQALWMSWGGLTGSWALVLAIALLVPLDSWASSVLFATCFGRAINASIFEVPIALRTQRTHNFKQELADQLQSPGVVQMPGLIVGVLTAAIIS